MVVDSVKVAFWAMITKAIFVFEIIDVTFGSFHMWWSGVMDTFFVVFVRLKPFVRGSVRLDGVSGGVGIHVGVVVMASSRCTCHRLDSTILTIARARVTLPSGRRITF